MAASERGPLGKRTRGPSPKTLERRQQALDMRAKGYTFRRIAQELGYHDDAHAYNDCKEALDEYRKRMDTSVESVVAEADVRLRDALEKINEIIEKRHLVVSHGQVVHHDNGDGEYVPLEDSGPVVAAIDRVIKLQQELLKVHGAYPATKQEVDVNSVVQYVIKIDGPELEEL